MRRSCVHDFSWFKSSLICLPNEVKFAQTWIYWEAPNYSRSIEFNHIRDTYTVFKQSFKSGVVWVQSLISHYFHKKIEPKLEFICFVTLDAWVPEFTKNGPCRVQLIYIFLINWVLISHYLHKMAVPILEVDILY